MGQHPGPRSRQLQTAMCGRLYPHQLLVIIVLLPVLDGLDHVVHKIVLHSQVQLASPVRLVQDVFQAASVCGPVLGTCNVGCWMW